MTHKKYRGYDFQGARILQGAFVLLKFKFYMG